MLFRKTLVSLGLGTILLAGTQAVLAEVEQYELDNTHSFVQFKISHLGFSTLVGRFNEISGEFSYDTEKPSDSSIAVTVKTTSLDTNHAERDKHLRGGDFFNTKAYPEASFKSTGFEADSDGKGTMSGELTLLGVTKEVSLDVTPVGHGEDPWGGYRRGFNAVTTIDRTVFGMDYDLGPDANNVKLELFLEGIRK